MNIEELKQQIAEEEAAAHELKKQYLEREKYITELRVKAITEEFGVHVGSIVVAMKNKTEFLVSRIEAKSYGFFCMAGRRPRTDGVRASSTSGTGPLNRNHSNKRNQCKKQLRSAST